MKKNTSGLLVIILLLAAAYFLNPTYPKHLAKAGVTLSDNPTGNENFNPNLLKGFLYKYNNYYLFSTTTNTITGQRATFGIFGIVFK